MTSVSSIPGPTPEERSRFPERAREDALGLLETLTERWGDLVRYPGPTSEYLVINRPDLARSFLQDPRWMRTQLLTTVLGQGTLASDGPGWRWRRRIVQPGFERARIWSFHRLMAEESLAFAERWAAADGPVDLQAELSELTLRVVTRALFGTHADPHVETVSEAIAFLLEDLSSLANAFLSMPGSIDPRRNRRRKEMLGRLDDVVDAILVERRQHPETEWPDDLLTRLLLSTDPETGTRLDDTQLRDEVLTMLVAGHETTATLLTWAFWELSQNPEEQDRFQAELDARFPDADPTLEDMMASGRVRLIVNETLRLHPPVYYIARRATETLEVDGHVVEAGTVGMVVPHLLHRRRDTWSEAERFVPDRFELGQTNAEERLAYFPFGRGGHACTGRHFATLEAETVLTLICRRFRLRAAEGHEGRPQPLVVMRMKDGLPMHLEPRAQRG